MAGMYPTNKEISSFGKTVKFPGVDERGKFTNGDFSNPDIPPSFLDADTINLVIDNLNTLVAHLGGNANNTDGEQLKKLFSITAEANKAIKRDSEGRAKVAPPVEDDDIARKAEIDAEAKARTQSMSTLAQSFQQAINAEAQARTQGDNTISGQLSSHSGNKSNPHGVSKEQLGLSNVDNTKDADKSVKYAASARHSDTSNLLQAYTTDDYAGGNHFIKAIRESGWNMRLYGCYFNGAKQSDCVKVNYANSAGKAATADSAKNADTVGGYKAGNGVNMLVPVVAFNVGENAGYIKLGNGLIVQWGKAASPRTSPDIDGKTGYWINDSKYIQLPLEYSGNYSIFTQGEDSPRNKDNYVHENFLVHFKSRKRFHVTHWDSNDGWGNAVWRCNWLTIGI